MHVPPLSRVPLLAAILVVVVVCAGLVRVASGSGEASVEITRVSGTLEVTNSKDGQAIFQASGLAPGQSVTGTVQLSNTGSLAGDLELAQLDVQDQPGGNGGRLSDAVQLDLEDITGGSAIPVFAGQLGGLGTQPLGSIAPGQARTYRFTASLPDTGAPPSATAGDNAYLGSGLTVRYVWTATAPDEPPDPGPGPGPGPDPGPDPGGGSTGDVPPAPAKFSFRVASQRLLKRGWLDVFVQCERGCQLDAWATLAKVRGAHSGHRHATLPLPGKTGRIRLKMSKKSMRALRRTLRTRRRVVLRVSLRVLPTGGTARSYSKRVIVKRPKPRR